MVITKNTKNVRCYMKKKPTYEELLELQGEMKKSNISCGDLAEALGMSYSGMTQILNGSVDIKRSMMKRVLLYMNKKSNKNYTLNDLFY